MAARTGRGHIAANVLNVPLRPPAVLARSAASLDLLSAGRLDLALGAGAFWDAIKAMGGRRLTPGQAVEALEEAIGIMCGIWNTDERGGVRLDGEHYLSGRFVRSGGSLLDGPSRQWAEELAEITLEYGVTRFITMADDAPSIELFAAEVASATRELVAAERATPGNGQRPETYSVSDQVKTRSRAEHGRGEGRSGWDIEHNVEAFLGRRFICLGDSVGGERLVDAVGVVAAHWRHPARVRVEGELDVRVFDQMLGYDGSVGFAGSDG